MQGKGRHGVRLPLPSDVGRALAAYLRRGRPRASARHLFLCSRAPHTGMRSSAIVAVARTALRRAGVLSGGAHLLRHTAATQLLRGGASLPEIAHVLRHRHIDTTAIYAKVISPRSVRWPGRGQEVPHQSPAPCAFREGVPRAPARSRVQAAAGDAVVTRLHCFPHRARELRHHGGAGLALGAAASPRCTVLVGAAAWRRQVLRQAPPCLRPAYRGASRRISSRTVRNAHGHTSTPTKRLPR